MKQIKIPFSLEEYNKGGYEVMTKGDKNRQPVKVRIVCTDRMDDTYPLIVLLKDSEKEYSLYYSNDGKYIIGQESHCDLVLVKQEFEDGDIITGKEPYVPFILPYRGTHKTGGVLTEAYYDCNPQKIYFFENIERGCGSTQDFRIATEEEKQKLFDALVKKGRRWNSEKKCIEVIKIVYQFKPFQRVLVRNSGNCLWTADTFGYYDKNGYFCTSHYYFNQCISYNEETKHLLGTTKDCPDKYKTW